MVFSDTSTDAGIVQEARYFVGANTTSYPINDLTRNVNRWFDKAVSLIFKSSGRWQWDDTNQTTLPSATTDLTSGQQDYSLEVSHLRIERVEVKDESGNWSKLTPFDKRDLDGAVDEFKKTDGQPQFYDIVGKSLILYPAPNYSQADSLKAHFQRRGSYFATDDTTKVAGFAEIFHRYLSLGAAYDYALKNNISNRNVLREEITAMEDEIHTFYAQRQPDEHIRLTANKLNYK